MHDPPDTPAATRATAQSLPDPRAVWRWGAVLAAVCVLPAVLMAIGVNFSTAHAPLESLATRGLSQPELVDSAQRALRGSFTHTLLEWTAVCTAAAVCLLALAQFRLTREPSLPIIGVAMACAGAMDAFHIFAADRLIEALADNSQLVPFTWAVGRVFNSLIILVGLCLVMLAGVKWASRYTTALVAGAAVLLVGASYTVIHLCATSPNLPQTMFPNAMVKRPFDLYPLIAYVLAAGVAFPLFLRRHRTVFAYSLLLSLIPQAATQLYMAFGSGQLHDACFNIAHGLKAVAYMVPTAGLLLAYAQTYHERTRAEQSAKAYAEEVKRTNHALKEAMGQLEQLASQDALTGLPNRKVFLDRVDRLLRRSHRRETKFAVLFFDFDRFKVVNDSLGHEVGDALLCDIASILRRELRDVDTVARFGGDEFCVLLGDLTNWSDAELKAQRLLDVLAKPHQLGDQLVVCTASIGLVTNELAYEHAGDMIRDADAAMYQAKDTGRQRVVRFDQTMHALAMDRLALEADLREAVNRQAFKLMYQPIVELESGRLTGFEALIRWRHPERGEVSRLDFIPIAEETGLIVPIGRWVLHEAAARSADWNRRLSPDQTLKININVSKRQLLEHSFTEEVLRCQREYDLRRGEVQLEITESTIADDRTNVVPLLRRLREHGFPIAMDDFGTGASSLSALHDFPIDVLKIDQAFIRVLDHDRSLLAVVASIANLAENLGVHTVAEGVESADVVGALQSIGCTWGQGYHFAKPMTPEQAEAYIVEHNRQRDSQAA